MQPHTCTPTTGRRPRDARVRRVAAGEEWYGRAPLLDPKPSPHPKPAPCNLPQGMVESFVARFPPSPQRTRSCSHSTASRRRTCPTDKRTLRFMPLRSFALNKKKGKPRRSYIVWIARGESSVTSRYSRRYSRSRERSTSRVDRVVELAFGQGVVSGWLAARGARGGGGCVVFRASWHICMQCNTWRGYKGTFAPRTELVRSPPR